jgi:hypothetical protein
LTNRYFEHAEPLVRDDEFVLTDPLGPRQRGVLARLEYLVRFGVDIGAAVGGARPPPACRHCAASASFNTRGCASPCTTCGLKYRSSSTDGVVVPSWCRKPRRTSVLSFAAKGPGSAHRLH